MRAGTLSKITAFAIFLLLYSSPAPAQELEPVTIPSGKDAIERGKTVFTSACQMCHGLKFYRGPEAKAGIEPLMDAKTAEANFGAAPPDLSLMAAARGKGTEGAQYIYHLLTTYYTDEKGTVKNRAFAKETQTDGMIAMPPPFPPDDPQLKEKARDVAAFLLYVSEPTAQERRGIGLFAIPFMIILTGVLYLLNRLTWTGIKK